MSRLRFNVNVFTAGMLLAVLLSAIGFSETDRTLQWTVPAVVLVATTALALVWPERRHKARKAPPV